MQRSTTIMSGIAGGLAAAATTYVFNPAAQCGAIASSLADMTTYQNAMKFPVATFATQFQNDFVHFFNLNYPTHGQDFHNLLMTFGGFDRIYDIGRNVSNAAFETFKTMVVDACVESTSSSPYVKSVAMGVAAGASVAMLARKFSLFSAETVDHVSPSPQQSEARQKQLPSWEENANNEKISSDRSASLHQLKKFTNQDVTDHRVANGYKR